MNELLKIQTNENQEPVMSGRELHEFLGVGTKYKDWFPRMIEYGFIEGVDYTPLKFEHPQNKQEITDHILKLDMAKEISMIQRNEKGKQARQYFIQVEKDYNSPEKIMARALYIADNTIKELTVQTNKQQQLIGELKPKADYMDIVLKSKGLLTTNQIAKDYGMSAQALNKKLFELRVQYKQSGQWLLYSKYHGKNYTHSETVDYRKKNGEVDFTLHTKWTQKGRMFLYNILKENGTLPNIEK